MKIVPHAAQAKENLNPDAHAPALSAAQRSNLSPVTARGYASWRAHSLSLLGATGFTLAREVALFTALCRPQPGQAWLDVGTSAGFYAGVLARAGAQVTAADLSPAMLTVAARREPSPAITWVNVNVEASGLPDASFDGITVGATLNETRDPARLLSELERLLRPGGQLWLMYVRRTAGPAQTLLSRAALGGLTFPDATWVARQLPGCASVDGLEVGAVRFDRFVRLGKDDRGGSGTL